MPEASFVALNEKMEFGRITDRKLMYFSDIGSTDLEMYSGFGLKQSNGKND